MHKIAISQAALDRMKNRMGKMHPFDTVDSRKTALLVVDMQNYFVKPGHQGEVPAAREIVPNINRLAEEFRRRGGSRRWMSALFFSSRRRHTRSGPKTRGLPRTATAPSFTARLTWSGICA